MPAKLHALKQLVRLVACVCVCSVLATTQPGCALGVMAGKMLFGDPKIECGFKARTGTDLTEGEKKLLVVCKTPYSVENRMPSLQADLNAGILKRLKQRDIKTESPGKVNSWIEENGGEVKNPSTMAKDFECDFIALVEVHGIEFYEENSRDMLRGNAHGTIRVFEVKGKGKSKETSQVYSGEFSSQYPQFSPVSIHTMSERVFQMQFVDHLSTNIARHFFDYRASDSM